MQQRTSLVVAHRLSTIQRCDRILVFHHGELRESGTHQQLLAQHGLYWRLFQLQYADEKLHLSEPPPPSSAAVPKRLLSAES